MAISKEQEKQILEARPDVAKSKYYSKNVGEWWKKYGKKEMGQIPEKKSLVQSVLEQTPAFREAIPTYDEYYAQHPELEQEDITQSKALYEPYFQQQISDVMEDLNAWAANEKVDYDRTLRRARASYAARNTGIGTRRENAEKETESDYQRRGQEMTKQTEREVGTEAIQGGGFSPFYQGREGEITGKMKAQVTEGQLWHKEERRPGYESMLKNYYKQDSNTNWLGQSIT